MTALADAAMGQLRGVFTAAADPDRAPAMAAYMRDQFPFLGLPTPVQRRLARATLRELPAPDEADVVALTTACWAMPEREYQYAGCDYAIRHGRRCGPGFVDHVRTLLITKSWWDTVDALAANVVGPLCGPHPVWSPSRTIGSTTTTTGWYEPPSSISSTPRRHRHRAPAGYCSGPATVLRPQGHRVGAAGYSRPTPTPWWRSWRLTTARRCRRALKWQRKAGRVPEWSRHRLRIRRPGAVLGAALGYVRAEGSHLAPVDGDGPVVFLQRVGGEGTEEPGPPRPLHRAPGCWSLRCSGWAPPDRRPTGSGDHWSFLVHSRSRGQQAVHLPGGRRRRRLTRRRGTDDGGRHRPAPSCARSDCATVTLSSSGPPTAASSCTATQRRQDVWRDGGTSPSAAW